MDREQVKAGLLDVLRSIQKCCGHDPNMVTPDKCPLQDFQDFDSKVVPVAITMVAVKLKVKIPNDKNVFLSPDGKRKLTIDQTVDQICKILVEEAK